MSCSLTATAALAKIIDMVGKGSRVIDVGSGAGTHAALMREAGLLVTTNSYEPPADFVGDFLTTDCGRDYDGVWAAHVLEHQPNPNLFLRKCFDIAKDGAVVAITVPPAKTPIVGGHVSLWNTGLLLYHMILAGFDCQKAIALRYGYNISVVVRKKGFDMPTLRYDNGDIETLAPFFPFKAVQGFNGDIGELNWHV